VVVEQIKLVQMEVGQMVAMEETEHRLQLAGHR
jgi:hypothetical protein